MQDATAQSNGEGKTGFLRSCFSRLTRRKGKMIVSDSEQQHPKAQPSWSTFRFSEVTLAGLRRFYEGDRTFIVKSGEPGEGDIEEAITAFQSDYAERRGGFEVIALIKSSSAIATLCSRIDRIANRIEAAKCFYCEEFVALFESDGYAKDAAEMRAAKTPDEYLRALLKVESRLKTEKLKLDRLITEQHKPKADNRSEEVKRAEMAQSLTAEIAAVEVTLKIPTINEDTLKLDRYCEYVKRVQQMLKPTPKNGNRVSK